MWSSNNNIGVGATRHSFAADDGISSHLSLSLSLSLSLFLSLTYCTTIVLRTKITTGFIAPTVPPPSPLGSACSKKTSLVCQLLSIISCQGDERLSPWVVPTSFCQRLPYVVVCSLLSKVPFGGGGCMPKLIFAIPILAKEYTNPKNLRDKKKWYQLVYESQKMNQNV